MHWISMIGGCGLRKGCRRQESDMSSTPDNSPDNVWGRFRIEKSPAVRLATEVESGGWRSVDSERLEDIRVSKEK